MKKIKKDDSRNSLRESVYKALYPSADKSQQQFIPMISDILRWIQNRDYSCSFQSSQKLEIDKLLNISVPHNLNCNIEVSEEKEPQNEESQKKLTIKLCSASKSLPLPEQKLQINEDIECELNDSKIQKSVVKQISKQSSASKSVLHQFEAPNEKSHSPQISSLNNFPQTYQAQNLFIEDIIEKYSKKREQNQSGVMQQLKIISPQTTDTQGLNSNSLFDFSLQNKAPAEKQKSQSLLPSKTKKKKSQKCRISETDENSKLENIQEKDKIMSQSQSLIFNVFNLNQKWGKMRRRKEARKYEIYHTKLYEDFFKQIPFYLHSSEGEMKLDEPKKRDNQEGKICQQFELQINPKILIGPLNVKKRFKLHIRFKKGYQGEVFYDKKLQNTIPTNPTDFITIVDEPLIFANNSDKTVKLVCCLIFDITQ